VFSIELKANSNASAKKSSNSLLFQAFGKRTKASDRRCYFIFEECLITAISGEFHFIF